jgi:hypothetical protein
LQSSPHKVCRNVQEQLVRRHLQDHIVGHISRDATEIEARENPPPVVG